MSSVVVPQPSSVGTAHGQAAFLARSTLRVSGVSEATAAWFRAWALDADDGLPPYRNDRTAGTPRTHGGSNKAPQCPSQGEDAILYSHVKVSLPASEEDAVPRFALDKDEAYSMTMPADGGTVTIEASTAVGALRGLTTLAQMSGAADGDCRMLHMAVDRIDDAPLLAWRGLLVDAARHYISPDVLADIVDGMAFYKLNVLHLHLVDADSFPFQAPSHPELSAWGAWGDAESLLTADALRELVAYAEQRGVMVVPEMDVPGHTASWGTPELDIVAPCWDWLQQNYTGYYKNQAQCLDPSKDLTFSVIGDLLGDVAEIFPAAFVHLGGDEVKTGCWEAVAHIREYMDSNGLSLMDTWEMFETRVIASSAAVDRTAIIWEEPFNHGFDLDPDTTVINVWKSSERLKEVVQAGFDAIYSFGFYLDRQVPACESTPCTTRYQWVQTWMDFYNNDLIPDGLSDAERKRILGAEIASWSESVDETNVGNRIFQRGVAAAERMWSAEKGESRDVEYRMSVQRCRLIRASNLRVGPLSMDYCPTLSTAYVPEESSTTRAASTGLSAAATVLLVENILLMAVGLVLVLFAFMRRRKRTSETPPYAEMEEQE